MQKLSLYIGKNTLYLLLLTAINSTLWSQNGENSLMYFDHLTIREGLPHNTIHCLLQDQYGYIWIGTQNGLTKYDGYDFEVHRSNEKANSSNGFVGKVISALYEDKAGNLWVGTRKHGINIRYSLQDTFLNLQSDSVFAAIEGYEISGFFEDKTGNIWIGTIGAGVLKYNPDAHTSTHFNHKKNKLYSDFAFDIVQDEQDRIWVATSGAGLNLLQEDGKFSLIKADLPNGASMESYRKTLYLEGESLWVGTEGKGLFRMNLNDLSFEHFTQGTGEKTLSSNGIKDIHQTQDGRLFIATDGGGLNIYDFNTQKIERHTYKASKNTSLNSNALFCFLEDRTGNIWIGTYNGGISILKVNKSWFETFLPTLEESKALSHRSILSLHQSRDGKIWVGTDGGGLTWLDPKAHRFSNSFITHNPYNAQSIGGNAVKTIFEDSQNRLWIGIFGQHCNIFDPKTRSFQVFYSPNRPETPVGFNTWSIAEQKDGTIWMGTIGEGLHVLDPNTQNVTIFDSEERDKGLTQKNIMVVFVDAEDRVWIGTADKGLNRWSENEQKFIHYQYDSEDTLSLSDNEIRAIFQDNSGNIWIGTEGGGLNRWLGEGNKFEHITQEDGLIANSVMGITQDLEGMIWVSTFEGITRLDPKTKAIRNFDFHRGQHHNQFNQMAVLTAQNGQLFFGGIDGLNAIFPSQVAENQPEFDLLFTDFKIFNESIAVGELSNRSKILDKPIEVAERVNLQYYDNSFSIDFAVTDFTNPLENTFEYKMEGFDEEWRTAATGQHSASYTNLDSDTYTFKVRHKGKEASIEVAIHPPFWETWWFKTLAFLLLIGLAYVGIRFWVKRREADKNRQILELKNAKLELDRKNLELNNSRLKTERENLELRNKNLKTDHENLQLRNENLKKERENLALRNENLKTEVEAKNSKLMFSAVQMAHKNEILTKIKKELRAFQKAPDTKLLRQLILMLNQELKSEDYWEEFNLYFNQVDQNFTQAILKKHPKLTKNDLRMCTLLRINLNTKEIASLLNVSVRGVEQSRYRLKKRLGLDREADLVKYIVEF